MQGHAEGHAKNQKLLEEVDFSIIVLFVILIGSTPKADGKIKALELQLAAHERNDVD